MFKEVSNSSLVQTFMKELQHYLEQKGKEDVLLTSTSDDSKMITIY